MAPQTDDVAPGLDSSAQHTLEKKNGNQRVNSGNPHDETLVKRKGVFPDPSCITFVLASLRIEKLPSLTSFRPPFTVNAS